MVQGLETSQHRVWEHHGTELGDFTAQSLGTLWHRAWGLLTPEKPLLSSSAIAGGGSCAPRIPVAARVPMSQQGPRHLCTLLSQTPAQGDEGVPTRTPQHPAPQERLRCPVQPYGEK